MSSAENKNKKKKKRKKKKLGELTEAADVRIYKLYIGTLDNNNRIVNSRTKELGKQSQPTLLTKVNKITHAL